MSRISTQIERKREQREESLLKLPSRVAAIYSLLGTAKLNGLNLQAFLREVIARIADHPIARINELLPWNLQLPTTTALNGKDATPVLGTAGIAGYRGGRSTAVKTALKRRLP